MKARKVYRNNEPSTATVTNSMADPNDTNTISKPPAYFMQEELQTKIMWNSYDLPFPIVDYYPFINPDTSKKITEEGRRQMEKLEKYVSELMEKHNIKVILKCSNKTVNPEKDT